MEGLLVSLLSSTTAASIMFPLIMAIGQNMGHALLLVVLSALMISMSQLFHISLFPNALVSGVCIETIDERDFQWTVLLVGGYPARGNVAQMGYRTLIDASKIKDPVIGLSGQSIRQ
jgi:hypothetical protein